jgi:hypothetical protein
MGLMGTKVSVRTYYLHLPIACEDRPECSSKTFITTYWTTRCPNLDRIMIPHHCEHLQSHTKEYKEDVELG